MGERPSRPMTSRRWVNRVIGRSSAGRGGLGLDTKSRMRREAPVRFCEGLGVQFPRATRLVMGFSCDEDARKVMEVLPKRFGKYGLTLHPAKTRLVSFQRPTPVSSQPPQRGASQPGAFDLLGFTHYWGRSRRGFWVVKRKTARNRFQRALRKIADWCRLHRHRPVGEQCQTLGAKLRGHFAYYGITGNCRALQGFRYRVLLLWQKWLARRSSQGPFAWAGFADLLRRFPLPLATVVHSVYRPVVNP